MSTAAIYDISVSTLAGDQIQLGEYRGKVLLIVNVASKCGFTSQYAGLEALYKKYSPQGLVVLGFPCNQFGGQEPGNSEEIKKFCDLSYGVTFPIFSKIEVNGEGTHPLYRLLKSECPGILGSEAIKWNFTKFLVDSDGKIVSRFASATTPEALESEIVKLLK